MSNNCSLKKLEEKRTYLTNETMYYLLAADKNVASVLEIIKDLILKYKKISPQTKIHYDSRGRYSVIYTSNPEYTSLKPQIDIIKDTIKNNNISMYLNLIPHYRKLLDDNFFNPSNMSQCIKDFEDDIKKISDPNIINIKYALNSFVSTLAKHTGKYVSQKYKDILIAIEKVLKYAKSTNSINYTLDTVFGDMSLSCPSACSSSFGSIKDNLGRLIRRSAVFEVDGKSDTETKLINCYYLMRLFQNIYFLPNFYFTRNGNETPKFDINIIRDTYNKANKYGSAPTHGSLALLVRKGQPLKSIYDNNFSSVYYQITGDAKLFIDTHDKAIQKCKDSWWLNPTQEYFCKSELNHMSETFVRSIKAKYSDNDNPNSLFYAFNKIRTYIFNEYIVKQIKSDINTTFDEIIKCIKKHTPTPTPAPAPAPTPQESAQAPTPAPTPTPVEKFGNINNDTNTNIINKNISYFWICLIILILVIIHKLINKNN
jgi:hypothetical protein